MTDTLENGTKIVYADEIRVRNYSRSRKGGTTITVETFDKEVLDKLEALDPGDGDRKNSGFILHMVLTDRSLTGDEKPAAPKPTRGPHGKAAQALRKSGFVWHPKVLPLLGSDEDYQEWCRTQKCCACGEADWDTEKGQYRNQAAHVRRAGDDEGGSGTAYKGLYCTVPLDAKHHMLQHQKGEGAVFRLAVVNGRTPRDKTDPSEITDEEVSRWFDNRRLAYLDQWGWVRLRELMGAPSMTDVEPAKLLEWAMARGVASLLPAAYKG